MQQKKLKIAELVGGPCCGRRLALVPYEREQVAAEWQDEWYVYCSVGKMRPAEAGGVEVHEFWICGKLND